MPSNVDNASLSDINFSDGIWCEVCGETVINTVINHSTCREECQKRHAEATPKKETNPMDFTEYNKLVEQEATLKQAQEEELRRIGFSEELDRLVADKNMDCLADIADQMEDSRTNYAKRFVYEKMYLLEGILEKEEEDD